MKWVLSHASDDIHHWQLQHEEGSRSLVIHLHRLSLRLTGFSKRLFFLQTQGFLQKKVLLRSEYGIVIGEIFYPEKTSPILFNGQKFFYQVAEGKLLLLDSEKKQIGDVELPSSALLNKLEFYSLLFGFAWFLTADSLADKNRMLSVTA